MGEEKRWRKSLFIKKEDLHICDKCPNSVRREKIMTSSLHHPSQSAKEEARLPRGSVRGSRYRARYPSLPCSMLLYALGWCANTHTGWGTCTHKPSCIVTSHRCMQDPHAWRALSRGPDMLVCSHWVTYRVRRCAHQAHGLACTVWAP